MIRDISMPHHPAAEKAVLGCVLQDSGCAAELRTEWFYDLRYQKVSEVLIKMTAEGKPLDLGIVARQLESLGIEDTVSLLTNCMDSSPSPQNFQHWAEIVSGCLILRRIVEASQSAIASVQSANKNAAMNPEACLEEFERTVLGIRQSAGGMDGEIDNRQSLRELVAEYEQAAAEGRPQGLATGFYDLDRLLGGLKSGQLFIIAARPAVGKTSLALNIAEQIAVDQGVPVGFFSLEMSGKELLHRLVCSRAHANGAKLNSGAACERDIGAVTKVLPPVQKAPLHICDRGGLSISQLSANARRMVQRHKIRILFVDYLGLLRSGDKGRSRYEDTTTVSNSLKTLAKDLGVPVVVLAQLNRENDREGRVPRLSDLRDSGAIEQDADIVGLLHRDESQEGQAQMMSLIIAKQRNGSTGKVDLVFHRTFTRFESRSFTS